MKKQNLKQRLDSLSKEGKEVKVSWEGGNDSGGFTVFVDNKELPYGDDFETEILSQVEYRLDYGSWAGDFYADGYVIYKHEEEAFVGEGKDVSTDYITTVLKENPIEVRVPKMLNFDSITIDIEGNASDDDVRCKVSFRIENGPVFEEHLSYEEKIENIMIKSIEDIVKSIDTSDGGEVNSVYNDWIIRRDEMEEDGDDLCFYIREISYGFDYPNYQSYSIPVSEDD